MRLAYLAQKNKINNNNRKFASFSFTEGIASELRRKSARDKIKEAANLKHILPNVLYAEGPRMKKVGHMPL